MFVIVAPMRTASVRALALAPMACVISLSAGSAASGFAQVDGAIRIDAQFSTASRGTFRITGAISDTGRLVAVRRIAGGRLQLTETLNGKAGTVRIRATRACSGGPATWRVLSGSSAYAGLSGGGTASGGPRCVGSTYPARATYRGAVRTPPPPPLAQPGRYGGGTSQRQEVTFDVMEGGRVLANLRLRVTTPCEGTPITTQVFFSLPGLQDIALDKSFSTSFQQGVATGEVSGRFTSLTTVEGTAIASTKLTLGATGTTHACSANVTWSASLPPPAVTPGQYCGFTNQGRSICLDVDATGRTVTRVEVGVVVLCNGRTTEVEVRMVFTSIPIGGNLGFGRSSSSLEGLISGTGFISGLLDPNGGTGAHGSVRLQLPVFDDEGTRYTCGVGTALWEARRQ